MCSWGCAKKKDLEIRNVKENRFMNLRLCLPLTSSGSMSLNSMPRPVQAMKWELDGSSSRATRNCQSCSEPLRWYDGPSRYRPDSCLMSPAGHVNAWCFNMTAHGTRSRFQGDALTGFIGKTHLQPSLAPRRCHRRNASPLCQTYNLPENKKKGELLEYWVKIQSAPSQHSHESSLVPSVLLVWAR